MALDDAQTVEPRDAGASINVPSVGGALNLTDQVVAAHEGPHTLDAPIHTMGATSP